MSPPKRVKVCASVVSRSTSAKKNDRLIKGLRARGPFYATRVIWDTTIFRGIDYVSTLNLGFWRSRFFNMPLSKMRRNRTGDENEEVPDWCSGSGRDGDFRFCR
jgi:hypothetical protein